jgi:hypothetical protein
MSLTKLKLVAPNGIPIIGVKLKDGKVGIVTCEYNTKNTAQQDWIFTPYAICINEKYLFIDSEKNEIELTCDEVFESSMLT